MAGESISNNYLDIFKNIYSNALSGAITNPIDFSSINPFSGGASFDIGNIASSPSIFDGMFTAGAFYTMPLAPMIYPPDINLSGGFGAMPTLGGFDFSMMSGPMFSFPDMSSSNNNFFKMTGAMHRTRRSHGKRHYGAEARPKDGLLHYRNRLSQSERNQITQIEKELNFEPGSLEKVIYIESQGNPKARNNHSGATGLIQFMPSTARRYGTTTSALYNMSVEEQLPYVKRYLKNAKSSAGYEPGEKLNKGEVYGLLLMPAYIKDDEGYWKGSAEYGGNKWLDYNQNGVINQFDLQKVVESVRIHY